MQGSGNCNETVERRRFKPALDLAYECSMKASSVRKFLLRQANMFSMGAEDACELFCNAAIG